jgi:hypothetical protein
VIFKNRYSKLDRLLHAMAFSSIDFQKAVSDIEDRIYAKRIADIEIDRPVFITSLPRAGTTLFLDLISSLDTFFAHTYRDMPFLLIPLLWNVISHRFQKSDVFLERAHGDGMSINYDSVEAFEEVLWHAFWQEKYLDDRIELWTACDLDIDKEFELFIKSHLRKLIMLRSSGGQTSGRYVSKNNANISRINKIIQYFSDAIIIIPFRNPVDHTGSMLRQHHNFQKIQSEDAFARDYMSDIGHFDFGVNFRPINFCGWLDREMLISSDKAEFWMKYWCETFEYLCSIKSENIVFLSYDMCCENPEGSLRHLVNRLGIDREEDLTTKASQFRTPTSYNIDDFGIEQGLHQRAITLHDKLLKNAIN